MDRVLIDGLMVAHRCYRAMDDLQTESGIKTGIEYGFLRIMEMLEREYPEAKLIVCWDCPTAKSKRQQIAPYYKHSRGESKKVLAESEKGLAKRYTFMGRVLNLRRCLLDQQWDHCLVKGLEADDIMHTLAKCNSDGISYIYTNDRDLLQSVVDDTIIMVKSRHSKRWEWNEDKIWSEYKVRPWQLPLYRSVLGDASDDIPGFGKLGKEKTAEYVRAAYRHESIDDMGPVWCLQDLVWKDRHRYNVRVLELWEQFTEEFLWLNFKLSQLTVLDGIRYETPCGDVEAMKAFLLSKEICSLALCRELLADDFKEEEF